MLVITPLVQVAAEERGRIARYQPERGCVGGVIVGFPFGSVVALAVGGGDGAISFLFALVLCTLGFFAFRYWRAWDRGQNDKLRYTFLFGKNYRYLFDGRFVETGVLVSCIVAVVIVAVGFGLFLGAVLGLEGVLGIFVSMLSGFALCAPWFYTFRWWVERNGSYGLDWWNAFWFSVLVLAVGIVVTLIVVYVFGEGVMAFVATTGAEPSMFIMRLLEQLSGSDLSDIRSAVPIHLVLHTVVGGVIGYMWGTWRSNAPAYPARGSLTGTRA